MKRQSIGFIGAGLMGSGMVERLLAAGHPVTVVAHRSRRNLDRLIGLGAAESATARELVEASDVLFTCVPNARVVEEIAENLVRHFRNGHIWIDATTSRPRTSEELSVRLSAMGVTFADAPVTGGPDHASEGTLATLVGCEKERFSAVRRLVSPYSAVVRRFGGPGRGNAAKLLNNMVTQGTMVLLSDAYRCAGRIGVDERALYDVMMAGAARSGTLEKAVGPALDGNFQGSRFSIANAAKDLNYARELIADSKHSDEALVTVLADRLKALEERGWGERFVSEMLDSGRGSSLG